ncbi:hypothetical protein SCLCIDRAFT_1207256 [Scleroderma citrinum Foug A]|uniref:Uncharacterized protein n=1 Tax=Scleroderma citrinum Foug A TaxID=1036808 RepID=A0A0C3EP86_9AGAM|nr:hypothetical protein SCLCIDRAFT_1207256 [Scleroderma citrinum Foug A]
MITTRGNPLWEHLKDPALILPTDHEIHSTSITHLQSTKQHAISFYPLDPLVRQRATGRK